jgi:hypothetical protein
MTTTMRAVVLDAPGPPEALQMIVFQVIFIWLQCESEYSTE